MALWKRLWLLVSVIWVVVSALNAGTIIAFSEEDDPLWKARVPILLGLAVPAALYAIGWLWERFTRKK